MPGSCQLIVNSDSCLTTLEPLSGESTIPDRFKVGPPGATVPTTRVEPIRKKWRQDLESLSMHQLGEVVVSMATKHRKTETGRVVAQMQKLFDAQELELAYLRKAAQMWRDSTCELPSVESVVDSPEPMEDTDCQVDELLQLIG